MQQDGWISEADTKDYILCDSIYITFRKCSAVGMEIRSMAPGVEMEKEWLHMEELLGWRKYSLDCDDGHMIVYICQNSEELYALNRWILLYSKHALINTT